MEKRSWINKRILWLVVAIGGILIGEAWWYFTRLRPADPDLRYLLMFFSAKDLEAAGDVSGAEAALRSAIHECPNRYEAYLALGDLVIKRGETNAAISNYTVALAHCGASPTNIVTIEAQRVERTLISNRIQRLRK